MWKKYFFILAFVPFIVTAQAWEWARNYGTSVLVDHAMSISKDAENSIYVSGYSWSPGEAGNAGYSYNWLKKLDEKGNLIWSDTIPFYTYTKNITDANGNTYIIGMATIAKFDSNGNQVWLKYIPHATLSAVKFLKNDLIISGYTQSYSSAIGTTSVAPMTGFFVRCNTDGNWQWVTTMADHMPFDMSVSAENLIFSTTDGVTGKMLRLTDESGAFLNSFFIKKYGFKKICTDKESNFYIYADISYSSPVIIDGDTIFLNGGQAGKCLLKYNKYGKRLWYKIIKGQTTIDALLTDKDDNLYVGGNIFTTLQIDSVLLANKGGSLYVAKLTSDGTAAWVEYSQQTIPTGNAQLEDMILDNDNNILIAGAITDKNIFGDITVTGSNNQYSDILIAKIKQETANNVTDNKKDFPDGLAIFPNPNSGIFTVSYKCHQATSFSLDIKNSLGQSIFIKEYPEQKDIVESLDLGRLAKGIYFIQVNTDQATEVKKIIIE